MFLFSFLWNSNNLQYIWFCFKTKSHGTFLKNPNSFKRHNYLPIASMQGGKLQMFFVCWLYPLKWRSKFHMKHCFIMWSFIKLLALNNIDKWEQHVSHRRHHLLTSHDSSSLVPTGLFIEYLKLMLQNLLGMKSEKLHFLGSNSFQISVVFFTLALTLILVVSAWGFQMI